MKSATFAAHLRKLRRQTGLTQRQFAEQWGVCRERISFFERRNEVPALRLLVQLNLKFGVNSFDWIMAASSEILDHKVPQSKFSLPQSSALPIGQSKQTA